MVDNMKHLAAAIVTLATDDRIKALLLARLTTRDRYRFNCDRSVSILRITNIIYI